MAYEVKRGEFTLSVVEGLATIYQNDSEILRIIGGQEGLKFLLSFSNFGLSETVMSRVAEEFCPDTWAAVGA